MSPDEPTRRLHDDVVLPFDDELDPELAAIDAELAKSGATLRRSHERDGRSRPSAAFASSLRERLLAEAAMPVESDSAPTAAQAMAPAADADGTRRVRPTVRRRTPTILPAPRWTILALAAVFVVALLGFNARSWFTGPAPVRATDVAATELIRGGTTSSLGTGAALELGDEVSVGGGGHATLAVGSSLMRLDAGAAVRFDRLTGGIAIEQLAGRVWHRVAPGTEYTVTTGEYRWTALGTAFVVARTPGGAGELLEAIAVEHAVGLAGPMGSLRVDEGSVARNLGGTLSAPSFSLGAVAAADLADPWLVANARLDAAAGYSVGILQTAMGSPTPGPSVAPVPETSGPSLPDATSTPASTATAAPTPAAAPNATPTAVPTVAPTPRPTPRPTPTVPPMGSIGASVIGCGETAVVSWDAYSGSRFAKVVVVRGSASFSVPTSYPPGAGITGLGGSLKADPAAGSYGDPLGTGISAWYRVLVLDAAKHTIAASAAHKATAPGIANLGPFVPAPVTGGIEATWTPYVGSAACFVYYKIVWSGTNPNPTYAGGVYDGYEVVGMQTDSARSFSLAAGTYWMRIEAVRYADAGTSPIVVGRSDVTQVTVP